MKNVFIAAQIKRLKQSNNILLSGIKSSTSAANEPLPDNLALNSSNFKTKYLEE